MPIQEIKAVLSIFQVMYRGVYYSQNSSTLFFFFMPLFLLVAAMLITWLATPSIIYFTKKKGIYDVAELFRKNHNYGISRLGGIAVFIGLSLPIMYVYTLFPDSKLKYLFVSIIILFGMGLKDDIAGMDARTKFLIQIIASGVLVIFGNVRLTTISCFSDIYVLSYPFSVITSILLVVLIINAFNLIDGIDGLLSVTGIIANIIFALLFAYLNQYELVIICLAISGALLGFLPYNLTNAKVFIGDSGAFLVGLIIAFNTIKFIELRDEFNNSLLSFPFATALAFAIVAGPVFDTFRVFCIRIIKRKSPFTADNNHIHHRLVTLGLSHVQTAIILAVLNICSILLVFEMKAFNGFVIIAALGGMLILANGVLTLLELTYHLNSKSVKYSVRKYG